MDNFWKWLKKANARAVFVCLVVALAGVTGWWVWKLATPVRAAMLVAGAGPEQPGLPLGVLAFMESQKTSPTNRAGDLFTPPDSFHPPAPQPKPEPERQPPAPQPKPEPEKQPPKPVPQPVKEVTQLTYRGMMTRSDGTSAALLWDSKSKRAAFYPMGTNVFGLKLQTIEAEALSVDQADGSVTTLKRGVPRGFSEGRHVE
jgi:hypothetical protein